MKRLLLFLLLFPAAASAQAVPACICSTPAGCKLASNPYPPPIADQPTLCEVRKAGVVISSGPPVPASTVPLGNSAVCVPASAPYNPGVAGSVACLSSIPQQPVGSVTLTMRASNLLGDLGDSAPYTFQSVQAIPSTRPPVPVIYGPVP